MRVGRAHLLEAHPFLLSSGIQQQLSELFVVHSLWEVVQTQPGLGDKDILVLEFLMFQQLKLKEQQIVNNTIHPLKMQVPNSPKGTNCDTPHLHPITHTYRRKEGKSPTRSLTMPTLGKERFKEARWWVRGKIMGSGFRLN